ncbi:hypothetical protein [Chitinophaga pinensis]|uniref:hypothetical protein n=1 Tax=Chitinophaga pinensis TaxID=79329 RepID=UPI001C99833E|nr:hypothetical protein [Chitinophaga pinensis]
MNITIVDDFLNKREISTKPPSKYVRQFKKENKFLEETLASHLIGDLDKFGIMNDDYEAFFHSRADLVSQKLKSRIIPAEIDKQMEAVMNEYDEVEEDLSTVDF